MRKTVLHRNRRAAEGERHAPAGRGIRRRNGLWLAGIGLLVLLSATVLRFGRRPSPGSSPAPASPSTIAISPAEQELRLVLARLPRDPDAHRALARFLLDQNRPFEALWHFQAALVSQPADPDTRVLLARALAQAGLPARARSLLAALLKESPADLAAREALAETVLATARPQEAVAVLRGAGAALATAASAQRLLGDAHAALGQGTAARAAYDRVVALEPEGAAGYDRLGRLAFASHHWNAAQKAFAAAWQRERSEAGHGFRLGLAYWGAGERQAAEQLWRELAAAAPGYAPVLLELGKLHCQRREWDVSAKLLAAAATARPRMPEAQLELAGVLEAMGRPSWALYQRGMYYLQTDRPHLALPVFRKMAKLTPASSQGALMVSFCWMQMKQNLPAARETQAGLRAHPGDPALRSRMGMLHVLMQNWPAAVALCREWQKADPRAAEPLRLLGRIAYNDTRYAEAVELYEKAVALDRRVGDYFLEMGQALASLRAPDSLQGAESALRRAVELEPDRAEHRHSLGLVLQRQGKLEAARDELLRALDRDPNRTAAASALVRVATALRQPAAARFFGELVPVLQARQRDGEALWREVGLHPESAAGRERLAALLVEAGDLRRAMYQLEQVVELDPERAEARQQLAIIEQLLALRES